jgi:hypothetical protein
MSSPSVLTAYRWELRKLRSQTRTYLGLGAAIAVPVIFCIAVAAKPGGPEDVPFGSYIHDTGLAIPLVLLLFGSYWLFPLITALVAGDIVAAEECLKQAFATDVRGALAAWRASRGLPGDPLAAHRVSGYEVRAAAARLPRKKTGGGSYA